MPRIANYPLSMVSGPSSNSSPVNYGGTAHGPTDASFTRLPGGGVERPPVHDRLVQVHGKVYLLRDGTRWHVPDPAALQKLRDEHQRLGRPHVSIVPGTSAHIRRHREVSSPPPVTAAPFYPLPDGFVR